MIQGLFAAALIPLVPHVYYTAPPSETGTRVIDESGFAVDGTLRGGAYRDAGAYVFRRSSDGNYDRITAPNGPSLEPGEQPFSFGAKIKVAPHGHLGQMAIIRHGDGDTPGGGGWYKMELSKKLSTSATSVACSIHDNATGFGYIRGTGGVNLRDGDWHTVKCTKVSPTLLALNIDGHRVTKVIQDPVNDVSGTSANLLIGVQVGQGQTPFGDQFVGRMDNIRLAIGS